MKRGSSVHIADDGSPTGWSTAQCVEIFKACCRSSMMVTDPKLKGKYEVIIYEALLEFDADMIRQLADEGYSRYFRIVQNFESQPVSTSGRVG